MHLRHRTFRAFVALVMAGALAAGAAHAAGQTQPAPGKTLYDRLGKTEGIAAVIADFVARVGADTRINRHFEGVDLDNVRKHMTDQICQATGGPCTYSGRDMLSLHAGMGISEGEFRAFMEDLKAVLEKHQVGSEDAGSLVGILLPMKKDIVEKP